MSEPFYNPIEKAKLHPKSKTMAIKAMCAYCMGFPDPGWRNQVKECTSPGCPLWTHRPYQQGQDIDEQEATA